MGHIESFFFTWNCVKALEHTLILTDHVSCGMNEFKNEPFTNYCITSNHQIVKHLTNYYHQNPTNSNRNCNILFSLFNLVKLLCPTSEGKLLGKANSRDLYCYLIKPINK